ncbi:MAG: TetR/AcrR family transcriptional regulator [Hyphomonadaceae bacterium JAD_PAG50586_4]|nr:MAG: TetR/AcrR family transcriptional regulator [Hyphomonadaceae bacterium JAD_PAG50586_4]
MTSDSIRDRILDATVDVLRRHGPAKTGVVDVARALDMSHSNVYKHFASKSALLDAVAERWLAQVMAPLSKITADKNARAEAAEGAAARARGSEAQEGAGRSGIVCRLRGNHCERA